MIQKDQMNGIITTTPVLHIDVYSAQTGVSRYLEIPGIRYNKTEDLTDFSSFDYLLTHEKTEGGDAFEVVGEEECFVGMEWRKARMRIEPCIYLLRNTKYKEGNE